MKHIGIIACRAEGAALCYQTICRDALHLVGKNDHPRITLDSIPLAAWIPVFAAGDYRRVAGFMLDSARVLATAGAYFVICPDNSAHRAWDYVQAETPIPWLHIARVIGAEAQRRSFRSVGVLGTRFTMAGLPRHVHVDGHRYAGTNGPRFRDGRSNHFSELVNGVVKDASRAIYNDIIARLRGRGCDAVALACTEVRLLVLPEESPLPLLDSTRLLAAAALRAAVTPTDPAFGVPQACL